MGISLRFRMNLTEFSTSQLVLGELTVVKDGNDQHSYRVTSGIPEFQFEGAEGLRARGPIPRCRFVGIDQYELWTEPTFQPQTVGVEGTFYNIDPERVIVRDAFSGDTISRSEFGIHFDRNVPGSAGCIVFRKVADYEEFEELMDSLRKSRVKRVPLHVDYNIHEKTWRIEVDGDRFILTESVNGSVFVPVRSFAERFEGSKVGFDPKTRRVTVNNVTLRNVNHNAGLARAPIRELAQILKGKLEIEGSLITVSTS